MYQSRGIYFKGEVLLAEVLLRRGGYAVWSKQAPQKIENQGISTKDTPQYSPTFPKLPNIPLPNTPQTPQYSPCSPVYPNTFQYSLGFPHTPLHPLTYLKGTYLIVMLSPTPQTTPSPTPQLTPALEVLLRRGTFKDDLCRIFGTICV